MLILTAILAGIVLQVQIMTRGYAGSQEHLTRQARLRIAAADAVRNALQVLADDTDLRVDHLDEPWAAPREYRDAAGARVTVRVEDAQGCFNLNNLAAAGDAAPRAPADLLVDIFATCGVSDPLQRARRLEEHLRRAAFSAGTAGAPAAELRTWDDLLAVPGYDRALFRPRETDLGADPLRGNVADALSILPSPARRVTRVNINTAGRDVLRGVFGMEFEGLVERILRERAARPIRSLDALGLGPEAGERARPYLGVGSSFFRVRSEAATDNQLAEIFALVQRDERGGIRVLRWVVR